MTLEHPFAPYVRILGKGKKGSRALTRDEAYHAMQMILQDQVEPVQLGAFLMLMRVKEESAEELAGFISAVRDQLQAPKIAVDLDWSSYAGKRRHLPWFLLSALLLAEQGIRVFMHGASGHTAQRLYTQDMLADFGLTAAEDWQTVEHQLATQHFCYMPLSAFCPKLHEIIELRNTLGLRSPVHTLSRMLNPLASEYCFDSIFHPGYRTVHQDTACLLGQAHNLTIKGDGGEAERNPDMPCQLQLVRNGQKSEQQWPPLFKQRQVKDAELVPQRLLALWRGEIEHSYGEASVIATTAVVLYLLQRADSQTEAEALAEQLWHQRQRHSYPRAAS